MGFAQELLTSKYEEMLLDNQSDRTTETTPSAPKRARKDDTDSVFWAQVDEKLKVHEHDRESGKDDGHSIFQKMVNAYLSEINAPRHSKPLHYWKEKRLHDLYLHVKHKSTSHLSVLLSLQSDFSVPLVTLLQTKQQG